MRAREREKIDRLISLIPGYDPVSTAAPGDWLDYTAAVEAVQFFPEFLRHVKGGMAGKPFELEDWQKAIILNLFGWRREDGTRRYREGIIYVPRKNGKTALAAGIVLFLLYFDGEPGAEIYSAARDKYQASLVYEQAMGMVEQDPDLDRLGTVSPSYRLIEYRDQRSYYKAIPADAASKHGYNAHGVVVDELHAQKNSELVEVLETSMGSRDQPLMLYITTADYMRVSICNKKYYYAKGVRDGKVKDHGFLPVIYEAERGEDWTDPEVWAQANPNLGVSVSPDYIERHLKKAQENPSYENTFKRLFLNIQTEQAARWIPMEMWDECGGVMTPREAAEELAGRNLPCYCGIDLASTTDLTAAVLVFEDRTVPLFQEDDIGGEREVGPRYHVLPYFWMPADAAKGRDDAAPYRQWADEGWLYLTPGSATDYAFVREEVLRLDERYTIVDMAVDPHNAQNLMNEFQKAGLEVVQFRQSVGNYNEPCRKLEELINSRRLLHYDHPMLRWMASHVSVKADEYGHIRPVRKGVQEKIDGIVALLMALARAILAPEREPLVYSERGFVDLWED